MTFDALYRLIVETPLDLGMYDYRSYGRLNAFKEEGAIENDLVVYLESLTIKNFKVDVYLDKDDLNTEYKSYYFVVNGVPVSIFSGLEFNGGIKTSYTESQKNLLPNDSFMKYVYDEFLLKKYKFILSDKGLTRLGYNFWYNNFDFFISKGYTISVIYRDKDVIPLNNKDELASYYSDEQHSIHYRFKIES